MKKIKRSKIKLLIINLIITLLLSVFVNAESFTWAVAGAGTEEYKVIETVVAWNLGAPHLSGNDICTSTATNQKGIWDGTSCHIRTKGPGKVYAGCVKVRGGVVGDHSDCIDTRQSSCSYRYPDTRRSRPVIVVDCYDIFTEARTATDSGTATVILGEKNKLITVPDAEPEPLEGGVITNASYKLSDDKDIVLTYFSDTLSNTTANSSAFIVACDDINMNNVCDFEENFCLDGYWAVYNGTYYVNGDYNSFVCECGEPEIQGTCDYGEKGCWLEDISVCCGDDLNESYNYRMGEIVDLDDGACCNKSMDCAYNNSCYSAGQHYELDGEVRYCINGKWGIVSELKCSWGNEICSYCMNNTQCMGPQGQCVDGGAFIGDHFCEDGKWASRTKLIALQLAYIANQESPDSYVLFCDDFENTLNYYWYELWGVSVAQYLKGANNICVLKLPEQVIFGASLNQPIDEGQYPFIRTLDGVTDCNNAIDDDDGNFHQCNGGDSKAWYNSKMQSVIYSREDIYNLPSDFELDFWDAFLTFLKNPFQTIFNFLMNLFEDEGELEDYDFINSTTGFSRIYLNRKNAKSITGITEEIKGPVSGEYISVTYGGFSENICDTLDLFYDELGKELPTDKLGLLLCNYDSSSGNHYVAINSSLGLNLWPELTARLRP